MLDRLTEWVRHLTGQSPQRVREPVDAFASAYEETGAENLTAVIAGRLATLTLGESTAALEGEGLRAQALARVLDALWRRMPGIAAQAWGKGGMVLVPLVSGGCVTVAAVDQSRITVNRVQGGRITGATVLAQEAQSAGRAYFRLLDYRLDPQTGAQEITQRCVDANGRPAPPQAVPAWAALTPRVSVSGTDRLLLAWLRCPRDARAGESPYGVPVTWGAGQEMRELCEHLKWYRREFRLARPMLGLDASLWRELDGLSIGDVRRTVQDEDTPFVPVQYSAIGDGQQWQHFAPDIRQAAFEGRLQSLQRRLEKACGLSQGILTDRKPVSYATRDEVRAAMYDTFSLVSLMRAQIERALGDALYAADVLMERFALTPAGARGQWALRTDWDMNLVESSQQTFEQLSQLQSRGLITGERLVQWVLGGTAEDARAEVEAARAQTHDAQTHERSIET